MEVVANIIATVWEYAAATMPDVDGTAGSRVAAEDGMDKNNAGDSEGSSNTAAVEVGVGGLRFVAQVEPSNTAAATWEQRGEEGAHNDGIAEVLAVESEHGVLADATAEDTATTLATLKLRKRASEVTRGLQMQT
eukprot:gene342-15245_t